MSVWFQLPEVSTITVEKLVLFSSSFGSQFCLLFGKIYMYALSLDFSSIVDWRRLPAEGLDTKYKVSTEFLTKSFELYSLCVNMLWLLWTWLLYFSEDNIGK